MKLACLHRYTLLGFVVLSCPLRAEVDIIFQDGFEVRPGFQVQTPDIVVPPGAEVTYCYYFRTANTATLGIKRWLSSMGVGMHHLMLFTTYDSNWNPVEQQPPGTLTTSGCGSGGSGRTGWVYAAHELTQDLVLPANDGSGVPLAVEMLADQPAFLQMYLLNVTDQPITTSALLKAEGLATGAAYTKTATYMTVNVSLSIPPGAIGHQVSQTCAAPAGSKFWRLSTRTHWHATQAKIVNSGADVVVTSDWEHPSVAAFMAPSFFMFTSGLTYQCTYTNSTGGTIQFGDSEFSDETCMGVGYFFPATRPMLCVNNVGPL